MTAQSAGQVLLAGGSLSKSPHKTKLCKAFRNAAKEFCAPGSKKRFNDCFYKELSKKEYGGLADQLTREVPALMEKGSQIGKVAAVGGELGQVVNPEAAQLMEAMNNAVGTIPGAGGVTGAADAAAFAGIVAFFKNGGRSSDFYMRFLDGQFKDGTVLELKGPGDKFHGKQGRDLTRINKGKRPVVLSCESCKAKCSNNGGGRKRGCG